ADAAAPHSRHRRSAEASRTPLKHSSTGHVSHSRRRPKTMGKTRVGVRISKGSGDLAGAKVAATGTCQPSAGTGQSVATRRPTASDEPSLLDLPWLPQRRLTPCAAGMRLKLAGGIAVGCVDVLAWAGNVHVAQPSWP